MSRQASLPASAGWGRCPSLLLALLSAVAWAVLGSALLLTHASAGEEGSLPFSGRERQVGGSVSPCCCLSKAF